MSPPKFPATIFELISNEKWITVGVIGSIFTFRLIDGFKADVLDPLMEYIVPLNSFDFMRVELKPMGSNKNDKCHDKNILKLGLFIREIILWLIIISCLFAVVVYGNIEVIGKHNPTPAVW